jgi:hypothetical protein
MKIKDPLDHEIEEGLRRLSKLQKVVLYFELLLRLASYRITNFRIYVRPRARIHWAGHAHRPRRYERLLMAVLLPLAVIVLGQHDYLIWAAVWGSLFAFAINGYLLFRFIPRRIRRWGEDRY